MSETASSAPVQEPSSWNLPNALTGLRLVLVPIFLWLLLVDTTPTRWWALVVFMVAAYTDRLDGQIARARNLITNFGKLADPLADKVMTLGAFIALSIITGHAWMWWFTGIVAVREIGITILREVLRKKGIVVAASSGGKVKTVLQIFMIWLMVIPWHTFASGVLLQVVTVLIWIVALATLVVTVVSGLQYVVAAAQGAANVEHNSPRKDTPES